MSRIPVIDIAALKAYEKASAEINEMGAPDPTDKQLKQILDYAILGKAVANIDNVAKDFDVRAGYVLSAFHRIYVRKVK